MGVSKADYRVFEYLIEGTALLACHSALFFGFCWHRLAGFDESSVVHRFWFPHGEKTLAYMAIALGVDVVQHLLAHIVGDYIIRSHGRQTERGDACLQRRAVPD